MRSKCNVLILDCTLFGKCSTWNGNMTKTKCDFFLVHLFLPAFKWLSSGLEWQAEPAVGGKERCWQPPTWPKWNLPFFLECALFDIRRNSKQIKNNTIAVIGSASHLFIPAFESLSSGLVWQAELAFGGKERCWHPLRKVHNTEWEYIQNEMCLFWNVLFSKWKRTNKNNTLAVMGSASHLFLPAFGWLSSGLVWQAELAVGGKERCWRPPTWPPLHKVRPELSVVCKDSYSVESKSERGAARRLRARLPSNFTAVRAAPVTLVHMVVQ